MISDPFFYAVAIPAVILFGLYKSGVGGALSVPFAPLIALATSPLEAVAIMLPIMLTMDVFAVTAYRRDFDAKTLMLTIPTGILGVAIGGLLAAHVSDAHVRLIIGAVAVSFSLKYWLSSRKAVAARPHKPLKARFWSTVSGFTSTIAHAGGVPYQMYTLPLRLAPRTLAATTAIFLASVNVAKVVPYFLLGLFDTSTLSASLVLSPLAPLSIYAGVYLIRIIPMEPFYKLTYAGVLLVGLKMLWDGLAPLL